MLTLFFATLLILNQTLMASDSPKTHLYFRWSTTQESAQPEYAFSDKTVRLDRDESFIENEMGRLNWKPIDEKNPFILGTGKSSFSFRYDRNEVELLLTHGPPYRRYYYYYRDVPVPLPYFPPPVYYYPPPVYNIPVPPPGPPVYPYPPVPPAVPYVPFGYAPTPSYFYFGFRVY